MCACCTPVQVHLVTMQRTPAAAVALALALALLLVAAPHFAAAVLPTDTGPVVAQRDANGATIYAADIQFTSNPSERLGSLAAGAQLQCGVKIRGQRKGCQLPTCSKVRCPASSCSGPLSGTHPLAPITAADAPLGINTMFIDPLDNTPLTVYADTVTILASTSANSTGWLARRGADGVQGTVSSAVDGTHGAPIKVVARRLVCATVSCVIDTSGARRWSRSRLPLPLPGPGTQPLPLCLPVCNCAPALCLTCLQEEPGTAGPLLHPPVSSLAKMGRLVSWLPAPYCTGWTLGRGRLFCRSKQESKARGAMLRCRV
jgi:hypothetical protein